MTYRFIQWLWYKSRFLYLFFYPFSIFVKIAQKIRFYLYKVGFIKSYKLPVKVIVIGNLTAGGSGKTPLTINIAQRITNLGLKVGIHVSGYKSKNASEVKILDYDSTAEEVGDEALEIAQLTGCKVVKGRDKVRAISTLLKYEPLDVVICDDGLQHHRLRRDHNILIEDAKENLNKLYIPFGPFRCSIHEIKSPDLIFTRDLTDSLNQFRLTPGLIKNIRHETVSKDFFSLGFHAVTGIAKPKSFFSNIEGISENIHFHAFPDHFNFSKKDLIFEDDLPILMTHKDIVKCNEDWGLPIYYLEGKIDFSSDAKKALDKFLANIQ